MDITQIYNVSESIRTQNSKVIRLVLSHHRSTGCPRSTCDSLTAVEAENIPKNPHILRWLLLKCHIHSCRQWKAGIAVVWGRKATGMTRFQPQSIPSPSPANPLHAVTSPSFQSLLPIPSTSAELLVSISTQSDTLSSCIPKTRPRVPPSKLWQAQGKPVEGLSLGNGKWNHPVRMRIAIQEPRTL